jgi:hypothetical protein
MTKSEHKDKSEASTPDIEQTATATKISEIRMADRKTGVCLSV